MIIQEPSEKEYLEIIEKEFKEKIEFAVRKFYEDIKAEEISLKIEEKEPIESIVDFLCKVLDYFVVFFEYLVKTRSRREEFLRKIIGFSFKQSKFIKGVIEDKYYPNSWETCDLFFMIDGYNFWLEIKTLPTNYCGGGGRNITEEIREVCDAIRKLGKVSNEQNKILLLAVFYPFCDGKYEIERWDKHLGRIYETCGICLKSYELLEKEIVLKGDMKAKAYLIWR